MKIITIEEHFSAKELQSPNLDKKVDARLKDMDNAGIDMQVISCGFGHSEFDNAAEATAAAKRINDQLSRIVKKYPDRFTSFASMAPQDPTSAAKELERTVKGLGFKGALIHSNVKGEYLDNPKFGAIFKMAEKLDVPIYLHPDVPSPDMIKPYLAYPVLTRSMWGFAAEAGLHAMRLICGGVFDVYPGLKIILGHMGESIPFWLWRIDNRWERGKTEFPHLYIKEIKKSPTQYFKDNFYVTTSGMFWPPVIQFVSSVLEDDQVILAVDVPHESNKDAVAAVKATNISEKAKERIFHLNAEKLLKL